MVPYFPNLIQVVAAERGADLRREADRYRRARLARKPVAHAARRPASAVKRPQLTASAAQGCSATVARHPS